MKHTIKQFITLVFLISMMFIITNTSVFAMTQEDLNNLKSYINGELIPSQVNGTNKAQYSDRYGISESIDPVTGELTLSAIDISLPGKDGLDLNIGRIYKSSMAEFGSMSANILQSNDGSQTYETGWYITVRVDDEYGNYLRTDKYGVFDTYIEAWELYAYFKDLNTPADKVIGETYYPAGPYYGTNISMYQFNQETFLVNHVDKYNFLHSRFDLGAGWAFTFPTLELINDDSDYMYYHDGQGGVYRVQFTSDLNDSNLKDYQGKDVQLLEGGDGFSYDGTSASYRFIEGDKRTTYFTGDGRILGIKDRFGNQIGFKYKNRYIHGRLADEYYGIGYKYISEINDSIGRTINFNYQSTISAEDDPDPEALTITVHDPNNTKTMQVVYNKVKQNIASYTSYGQVTYSSDYDYYEPVLESVTNPIGQVTSYATISSMQGNKFQFLYYGDKDELPAADSISNGSISPRYIIVWITYPYSKTKFDQEHIIRNLGDYGFCTAYRYTQKYIKVKSYTGSWTYELYPYAVSYQYTNDCTGFPTYTSEERMKNDGINYEFSSTSIISYDNDMQTKITTIYNNKKQMLRKEIVVGTYDQITAGIGDKTVIKNLTFDANFIYKPTRTEISEYSSSGTLLRLLYVDYVYNDWGGLQSETLPLTAAQRDDPNVKTKYTITYQYNDPTYKFITNKQWYQNINDSTPCSETYTYDTYGRILTFTNAKGEVTSYNYSNYIQDQNAEKMIEATRQLENGKTAKIKTVYGIEAKKAYPTSIKTYYTNDQGVYTETGKTKTYDLLTGLVATETDANGKTTSYTYDSVGRPLTVVMPNFTNIDGQTYSVQENYSYTNDVIDDAVLSFSNQKIALLKVNATTVYTDAQNNSQIYNQTESYYDFYGNLRLEKVYNNTTNQWINKNLYYYDCSGRLTGYKDANNNTYSYDYDSWGRLCETTDAFGNLQRVDYDFVNKKITGYFVAQANVASFRANPSSNTYKENVIEGYKDQWDRIITKKAYPNWPNTSGAISETYTYDVVGNLIGYKDPKGNFNEDGNTTTNTYDKLNRLVKLKDALNQITEVSYNILGNVQNVKMRQNAGAQAVDVYTKSYDELAQMTSKTDPMSQSERYVYNSLGLNTQKTDKNGTNFTYVYDEYYRVTSDKGGNQEYKYLYNNPFGASKVKDYSNLSNIGNIDYTYNYEGAVKNKTVSYAGDTFNSALTNAYDNAGKLNSLSINGFYTNYKYDKTRLNKVQTNGQQAENTSDQANATYEYYPDGKLKKITYPQLSDSTYLTTEYLYDKLNRLTTVTNKKGAAVLSQYSYGYDNNGNITTVTDSTGTTTYVYDKLNRLTEVHRPDGKTIIYSYDLKGNRKTLQDDNPILDIDNVSYAYNVRNQLESVTKGATTTSLKYSPDGLRYKKATPTKTVLYHYNLDGEVIAEADGSNTVTANYIWGPDRALVKKDASTGNQYYYLYNGHGDVVQIVDSSGNVVNNYKYDEWGNILTQTEGIENPFKYAGEIYDSETGLYYLRSRMYDPQLGRFLSEDSFEGQINSPLSLNLYTYTANNPLMYIDPSGHVYVIAWSYGKHDLEAYKNASGIIDWDRFTKENSFARAAYTRKQELLDAGVPKSEIDVQRIDSAEDLKATWKMWSGYKKIDQLHFYSHGYTGGAEIAGGSGDYWGTEEKLNWGKNDHWTDNRYAVFYGCNTGKGDFAQNFADRQRVTTYAPDDYANFSQDSLIFKPIVDKATTGKVYLLDFDIKALARKSGEWMWKGVINNDGFGRVFYPR